MEETTLVLRLNSKDLVWLGVGITNQITKIEESLLFKEKDKLTMEDYKAVNSLFDKFADALTESKKNDK